MWGGTPSERAMLVVTLARCSGKMAVTSGGLRLQARALRAWRVGFESMEERTA